MIHLTSNVFIIKLLTNRRKHNHIVRLRRRTNQTSTHQNIVDDIIKEIKCYKINKSKMMIYYVLSYFTFGIISIVSNYFTKMYLGLTCSLSNVHEADYFLITDKHEVTTIVESKVESFCSRSYLLNKNIRGNKMNFKKEMSSSIYLGPDYQNAGEETIVTSQY